MKKTFTGNRSGEERLIHTDILSCLSKNSIELKQFHVESLNALKTHLAEQLSSQQCGRPKKPYWRSEERPIPWKF